MAQTAPVVERRRLALGRIGRALVVLGLLGAIVGAFLPWVYSGAAARNSFGVVRAARALGIVESGVIRAVLALWYFVPLFAAVVVILLSLRRDRVAGSIAAGLGVIVLGFGLMVGVSGADLGRGPAVACVTGVMTALGGVLVVRTTARYRSKGMR